MLINSILDVELGVTRLDHVSAFYESAWGLEVVSQGPEGSVLRAASPEHHVLVLRPASRPGLISVGLAVRDITELDAIYQSLLATDCRLLTPVHPVHTALGGGHEFEVEGPAGLIFRIATQPSQHCSRLDDPTRPQKLSHVVLNSPDRHSMVHWLVDSLGFRISDTTRTQTFLRCGPDHHSIAISTGKAL